MAYPVSYTHLDVYKRQGPAVFLASEASNAVNGHILYVDGGILAYIGTVSYTHLAKF